MLKGYMKVTYTGTYTFYLDCDDGAYMWFGDNAITNWRSGETLINYDINNGGEHGQQEVAGTVVLTAGSYIPIRVAFGNNGGPGILIVSYSHPGQAKTSDFTGKIFYRTTTNGF
jgi:hexosaminidase